MWVLSSVEGNESVIANGFLADNTVNEAIEIYMGELLGEKNYDHFGPQFPLLIKLIDAADRLSIQVHPDDTLAHERGMDNGKTEMWYVLEADKGAEIVDGFAAKTTPEQYQAALADGTLESLLHVEHPKAGDVLFIPAGRVHAIGKGILLAEIQQSSDCTYRIYDYNRPDADGHLRELHTAEALAAIDFGPTKDGKTHYSAKSGATTRLAQCPYFTTSIIPLQKPLRKSLAKLDSFVVYLCVEGIGAVKTLEQVVPVHAGECVLVPAVADNVELFCEGPATFLEIYADPDQWVDNGRHHNNDNDWIATYIGNSNDEEISDDEEEDDYADPDSEDYLDNLTLKDFFSSDN
jgi:mannose-6-phosphate isomerase